MTRRKDYFKDTLKLDRSIHQIWSYVIPDLVRNKFLSVFFPMIRSISTKVHSNQRLAKSWTNQPIKLVLLLFSMVMIFQSSSCTKVKELEYRGMENVKVKSISLNSMTLLVNLKYYNPNGFGIDVKQTQLSLYLNDKFIGLADQPDKTQIPKQSEFIFPVIVRFDPLKALGTALSSIFSKTNQLTIQGNAKLGKGGVYITVPLNITENISISQ